MSEEEGKFVYTFIMGALQITIVLAYIPVHPFFSSSSFDFLVRYKDSPEMHSLNPNRTIPQPPGPTLAPRWRSSTLPSPTLLLEPSSRRPESLRLALCSEEL
jgi:hypothetical protein